MTARDEAKLKHVRVYYTIGEDDRFRDIYHDDRRLGAWLRLLLIADAVWPASAPLPASIAKSSLKALIDAGVIDLLPGHMYRIHGLDAERERRSASGRNAAAMRWQSDRNATASTQDMRPQSARSAEAMSRNATQRNAEDSPKSRRAGLRSDHDNPRSKGTSPRQTRTNPRANGTSPRQLRDGSPEIDRRAMQRLGDLLPHTAKGDAPTTPDADWFERPKA